MLIHSGTQNSVNISNVQAIQHVRWCYIVGFAASVGLFQILLLLSLFTPVFFQRDMSKCPP